MVPVVPNPEPILYIEDIGISVTRERVSLLLNDINEATRSRAEQVAIRLFETLPHTPFGAFGVNFNFVEDNPNEQLLDVLKTKDGIDQHYKIQSQNLISAIAIEDQVSLNFSRRPSENSVIFNFNYHHQSISTSSSQEIIPGSFGKYFDMSQDIVRTLYDIEYAELLNFEFGEPDEKIVEGANENAN